MAKITIEELSDSLKEYLNGLGLTEAQVQELINLWVDDEISTISNLQTESKIITESINELKSLTDNKDLSIYQPANDDNLNTESKNIIEAINEIYNSQNIIKQDLVAALVNIGLSVTTDMEFNELMDNLEKCTTIQGDAVASDVLSGKTFKNNTGELITGTMKNQGSKTITPSKSYQTLNAGYYSKITINGNSNLIASNIKKGVTIFGVAGTYVAPTVITITDTFQMALDTSADGYDGWWDYWLKDRANVYFKPSSIKVNCTVEFYDHSSDKIFATYTNQTLSTSTTTTWTVDTSSVQGTSATVEMKLGVGDWNDEYYFADLYYYAEGSYVSSYRQMNARIRDVTVTYYA